MAFWKQVPNEELALSNIPSRDTSWDEVKRFAASFEEYNGAEADGYQKLSSQMRMDFLAGKKLMLDGLDINELRAVLFLHWRALQHGYCGGESSPSEMTYTWDLIDAIRRKVAGRFSPEGLVKNL